MHYKFYFCLIWLIGANANCQKVEILLIGVSHNYSNYPEQDFRAIHAKIKKFKPTAFFGEFLSKEDERLVMEYWCKQDNVKRLKFLKKNRDIPNDALAKTVDSLVKLSRRNPNDFRLKTDLAHAYYLNQDVANGHFQFWQVFRNLQQKPNAELENYMTHLLSPQLDVSGRSMKRLKTSEYAYIAFPVMLEMGINELLPMDCQDYDLNWSASSVAFHGKFDVFEKDSIASETKGFKPFLSKRLQGFEKNTRIEKTSKNVTEWQNTDEASAIFATGDFYYSEMYNMNDFPKDEMLSQLHWWLMRNKEMCRNVVNRARASSHKKVVVIAGANHRKFMQDIFRTMPNVTVKNINELE